MNMMSPDIDKLFQKTKGQLFFQQGAGFYGPLLGKLKFQWDRTKKTAAISDTTLYWNPDFFLSLDEESRVTILCHELKHNGHLHGLRMGSRDPEIWNEACDHHINLDLRKHGYYMGGFPYVMDDKYEDWVPEDIYADLIKQCKAGGGGSKPSNNPLSGDVLPVDASDPAVKAAAIERVVSAKSAAFMSGNPGDVPGDVTLMLEQFLNPELPWEVLLHRFFNALSFQEYSYQRPNRRYDDPIMRGPTGTNGLEHLVYFLDISGSVTDHQILQFNSEVKHIQEELEPERLTLITFDTKIRDVYEFERDDSFEKIEVTGRGGTDLNEVFTYLKEHRPTAAAIFTDLYVHIPPDPGVPLIWVISDNPGAEAPFGTSIHFKEAA